MPKNPESAEVATPPGPAAIPRSVPTLTPPKPTDLTPLYVHCLVAGLVQKADGSRVSANAIVTSIVGEVIGVLFSCGTAATYGRADVRILPSFPAGEKLLFARWLDRVTKAGEIDLELMAGMYDRLRPASTSGSPVCNGTDYATVLYASIQRKNEAGRLAAKETTPQ
jgi:hypothetical protein